MKTKIRLIIICMLCICFSKVNAQIGDPPPLANNLTPANLKAAEELVTAQHMDLQVVSAFNKVFNTVGMSVLPEKNELFISVAKTFIDKYSKWENFKTAAINMYAETYTLSELKQLTDFYKTPTGQKLAENQISMAQQMVGIISKIITEHKQEFAEVFKK